jgi:hypothetical protein
MTSVACRVPDAFASRNLWRVLGKAVRQGADPDDDDKLLIDDSKVVYSTARGLGGLERGVHAALGKQCGGSLHDWLEEFCAEGWSELAAEFWYRGDTSLPAVAVHDDLGEATSRFAKTCATAGVACWRAQCVVVCPSRFNSILDAAGTKGAVLAHSLSTLLRRCEAEATEDAVHFFVDKHGGRNTYAAFIQHALEAGAVMALEEGMNRSVYRVHGLGRDLHLTFQPRADAEHFCVALASMASKYVRELCMAEFNRFWLDKLPGLKPTAGYPGDAARFWESIRPAVLKMGLTESQVWRRK